MAAARVGCPGILLCSKATSASANLQNLTVSRQYATGVVQGAMFLMKRRERKKRKNSRSIVKKWVYKNPSGQMRLRSTSTDWPSVLAGYQSYNPAAIPLFIRMGRMNHMKFGVGLPNRTIGNLELMKIPNFFHLTPVAVKRHCQALEPLCTEWPRTLDLTSVPLRVTTKNYLFAGPSLYHPGSRVVKLQVYLKDLVLDGHSRKKLIALVEDRYDPETDELTIVADRCPTRKQNRDYAMYLLAVLYHESWKTEPWETKARNKAEESDDEDDDEMMEMKKKPKNPRPLKLIDGALYRVNKYGKYFKLFINEKD